MTFLGQGSNSSVFAEEGEGEGRRAGRAALGSGREFLRIGVEATYQGYLNR